MAGRLPIHRLMIWVAVAAANFGAFRLLYSTGELDVLLGGMLAWIGLQFGVFRAYRGVGRVRSSWIGFASGGVLVGISLGLAKSDSGSILAEPWYAYAPIYESEYFNVEVGSLLARAFGNVWGEAAELVCFTVLEFLPVGFAAIVGGVLGRWSSALLPARSRGA